MAVEESRVNPLFTKLLRETLSLTKEEYATVLNAFCLKNYRRKEHYLMAGEVCTHKAYVNKGLFRTYVLGSDAKEHILYFPVEDWWLGDIESFVTRKPGINCVQALEESELLVTGHDDFMNLTSCIPKFDSWFKAKVEKSGFANHRRLTEAKTSTAEERYLNMLNYYPHLLQRVPQQYIAAYLDIEPPSLSRLRKRIHNKGK